MRKKLSKQVLSLIPKYEVDGSVNTKSGKDDVCGDSRRLRHARYTVVTGLGIEILLSLSPTADQEALINTTNRT